jgi:hypothetical protein
VFTQGNLTPPTFDSSGEEDDDDDIPSDDAGSDW